MGRFSRRFRRKAGFLPAPKLAALLREVRETAPDAVILDPENPELHALIAEGVVTADQCYEAVETGAMFFSRTRGFIRTENPPASDEQG